ncbi:hypothetical protein SY88_15660 [Clostridiales bacterium PH28_bin88]|nr:hypothetical protein SY88_15660 [Clostridiales bacterium PH28_bin88]
MTERPRRPTNQLQSQWFNLFLVSFLVLAAAMSQFSYAPMSPFLIDYFHLTKTQMGVLASAVFLGVITTTFIAGWMVDVVGVRKMILVGPGLMALSSIGVSMAHAYWVVFGWLFLLGVGNSVMMPLGNTAIFEWFRREQRGLAMGIKQSGMAAGPALGAALLPGVSLAFGWQRGYQLAGLLLAGCTLLSYLFYRDPENPSTVGLKQSVPSLAAIKEIFFNPDVWLVGIFGLSMGGAQVAFTTFSMPYFDEVLAIPVVTGGALLALTQLSGAVGRPVFGMISDRVFSGRRKGIMCMTAFAAVGFLVIMSFLSRGVHPGLLVALMILMGLTIMGWAGPYFTLIVEVAGERNIGLVSSMAVTMNLIGIMSGPPLFGLIVDSTSSYRWAFRFFALWLGIASLIFLFSRIERLGPLSLGEFFYKKWSRNRWTDSGL